MTDPITKTTVEVLGEEFKQICKSGDVDRYDEFHKQHCAHSDECNGNFFESGECYTHDEKFWKQGFQGAFEGNHLHIVQKLGELNGCLFYNNAQYNAFRDPNVKKEIVDYFKRYDMSYADIPHGEEAEECHHLIHYSNRKCYLAACERGEVEMFEYLSLHRILKDDFEMLKPDDKLTDYYTNTAKRGFEIACKKGHNKLMIYLEKLYKECGVSFVCGGCGRTVPSA